MSQQIRLTPEQRQIYIDKAKAYITDQYNEGDGLVWLEGWIHGYTDVDHKAFHPLQDELMIYLAYLRKKITFSKKAEIHALNYSSERRG